MNGSHSGPATVIVGEAEIPVHADLWAARSGGLTSWGGVLRAEGPTEDFWALHVANDLATLRLDNGREGRFMMRRTRVGSGRAEILGSGPAPF